MMQGTPYVYQGEELGMTNCPFGPIENYRDLESINAYHELTEAGLRQPEELLECIAYKSRDNARTPMQWNDKKNAGFTEGTPWIMVNPNYTEINAEKEMADPDSVFHYYRKLIALRRSSEWSDLIVYGHYELLAPEDPYVFAYIREYEGQKLLVICNVSDEKVPFQVPESVSWQKSERLIGNYEKQELARKMEMKPWEAMVWSI